ncbi:MAG TPA: polyketide synthase [Polyangiaceae bacterium]|nr:polyketide synthase [Polyangiaceae bacterium]
MTELDPTGEEGAAPAPKKPNTDVAIVGLAGRFPGARNIDEFWENLQGGVESIVPLSEEHLLAAGVSRAQLADPDYVRACPLLADVDKFDAGFFGFSPRDASVTDPAHRFFLEVVYEALEHSGNTGLPEEGTVAVFAGSGASYYYMDNVRTNPALMRSMGEFLVRHTGNDMNFLATRASYEFDFRGPSVNVQTACSSALVSLHMACKSLFDRECDMAIIGGATIQQPHNVGYQYSEGEIVSPDGHCRAFDARSAGTVFGSGAGALVLKRLDDALDHGDTIHAVVRGSAINNDGAVKVGFLAPGVEGQVGVVVDALKMAGLSAEDISFVEAHGTGTRVGDPIELTALQQAYETFTNKKRFCGVGSVKSNIGHLGEAAAAASLIKMVLSLKHRELPATLGYESPNEQFDMQDSPFYVNAELRRW